MTAPSANGSRHGGVGGNVLLIDDCAVYREALASALAANGIGPVRTAWDLPSVITALESAVPRVILLNNATIGFPKLLRATAGMGPRVPVVVLGVTADDEDAVISCAEAGVAGYHMRSDSLTDLLALINVVVDGGISCPPQISAMLLRQVSTVAARHRPAPRDPGLTTREIQILRMLELGRSNQDIATALSIAVHTVKNHVHSLLTKLGVNTRTEAAALAHTLRLDQDAHRRAGSRSRKKWTR